MDDLDKTNDTEQYMRDFESFVTSTETQRVVCEEVRDFCDGIQWTAEEVSVLESRKQIPVTFDYMGEQVDLITAMERDSREDPKAYPRTKDSEETAECVTDALRYISDNNNFQDTASDCFKDLIRQAYCAAKVEAKKTKLGWEIQVNGIPWDRFYYDPHSRKKDFSDASFMGIVVWMNVETAKQVYKKHADEINDYKGEDISGGTYDDKPTWYDNDRKRVRVCEHYYKKDGKWHYCHFIGSVMLIDPQPVEYKDEFGDPVCPIIPMSAMVDRENNRIPYMKRFVDPQREVNHRRSKSMHFLNSKQVVYEDGTIADPDSFAEELKKPDGIMMVAPDSLSTGGVQINPGEAEAAGHMQMYADAVGKLDRMGANAALQGDVTGMSGRAIDTLKASGGVQLGSLFDCFRLWKRLVYRQMWYMVKQFWDEEKWVRVTDSEDCIKWVGLNYPVTYGEALAEEAEKGSPQAAEMLQMLQGDPRLQDVAEVRNRVSELDVDIIIAETPDTINAAEEQFGKLVELAKFYGPEKVPFEVLLELSTIPNKARVKDMLNPEDPMAQQMAAMQQQMLQMQQQIQMALGQAQVENIQADTAEKVAKAENTQADTMKKMGEAEQTALENQTMVAFPDTKPNVNI